MNNFANTTASKEYCTNLVADGPPTLREVMPVQWLQRCASRLNLPPIPGVVVDDLNHALPLAFGDSRYSGNTLAPGSAPIEVSFSETQPRALRVDLEPFCLGLSPGQRRQYSSAIAARWIAEIRPPAVDQEYETRLASLCVGPTTRFGAYLGATFDGHGLAEVKIYSEWNNGIPAGLPERLSAIARTALDTIPSLAPHFASFSFTRQGCVPRLYFFCREEVPLLAMYHVLKTAGLSHRLAELAHVLNLFIGINAILPAAACVISFREIAGVLDCKLEVLTRTLPVEGRDIAVKVRQALAQRPDLRTAIQYWWNALGGTGEWPGEFNAVGFRLSSTSGARFGVYLSPERLCLKSPRPFLDTVSTGSGSDLVSDQHAIFPNNS